MFKVHIIFERLEEKKSMTVEDCCVWGGFQGFQGFKDSKYMWKHLSLGL